MKWVAAAIVILAIAVIVAALILSHRGRHCHRDLTGFHNTCIHR